MQNAGIRRYTETYIKEIMKKNQEIYKNFAFNPSTITIPKGTTVVWTNNDSVPHTVTSSAGMGFDSGTLNQGAIFSRIFNDVGTFSYGCSIHPAMKGTIIVTQ